MQPFSVNTTLKTSVQPRYSTDDRIQWKCSISPGRSGFEEIQTACYAKLPFLLLLQSEGFGQTPLLFEKHST